MELKSSVIFNDITTQEKINKGAITAIMESEQREISSITR